MKTWWNEQTRRKVTKLAPKHGGRNGAVLVRSRFVWLVCCASLAFGGIARADASTNPRYQGSHWSMEAHGGFATALGSDALLSGGPTFGLSLRIASVLSLADVQLDILGSVQRRKSAKASETVDRGSAGLSARLHPFFLLTLNDSMWETLLAGIYLEIGSSLELTAFQGGSIETDLGWRLGFGIDIPLTSLEGESSVWLGFGFRATFFDLKPPSGHAVPVDAAAILVSVGYRNHDINFTNWPRPSEFSDSP